MNVLLAAAVLPVVFLCKFVYQKDPHHEPTKLLFKIFALGFVSAIPILIVEMYLTKLFPTQDVSNFILIFINTFMSIAIVEEGFKWIVTMYFGYRDKEFDEIYDIIVYAVFASLGFACIENILYVFGYGLSNAVFRAFLSIPGHMSFGVIMGYFLAQAKVGSINKNIGIFRKNILLSILMPAVAHTIYDALLFCTKYNPFVILIFFIFDITMVVLCIITVNKTSKIQQNLDKNLNTGVIYSTNTGQILYNNQNNDDIHYCPVCGTFVDGYNYCAKCGFKIK